MQSVTNQNLAVTLESQFIEPRPFDSAIVRKFATAALQQFSQFGIKPADVSQRTGDGLFDYDVTVSLFNGQALLRLGSDRLWFNIRNVRNRSEANLVVSCGIKSSACIDFPAEQSFSVQANIHASFAVIDDSTNYFMRFVDQANHVIGGGQILIVHEPGWSNDVRVSVERSLAFPNAVFINLNTEVIAQDVTGENFHSVADRFDVSLKKTGLELIFE